MELQLRNIFADARNPHDGASRKTDGNFTV
jgi:hypothetical protein